MYSFFSLPRNFSCIDLKINNALVVPFLVIKPICISSIFINLLILFSSTLSAISIACSSGCTPLYTAQSITFLFLFKIGTTALVFHFSGIPGCSNHAHSCILLTPLLLTACHNVNRFVASSLFLRRVIFPYSYRILLLC